MSAKKQSYVPRIAFGSGGDALNCAIAFRNFGRSAAICGKIGSDLQGEFLTGILREKGVLTEGLAISECLGTGTVVNLIQNNNEASYVASLGANAAFCDSDVPEELLKRARIVCVNSLFGCGNMSEKVLKRAKSVRSLDGSRHHNTAGGCRAFADCAISRRSGLLFPQHRRSPAAYRTDGSRSRCGSFPAAWRRSRCDQIGRRRLLL